MRQVNLSKSGAFKISSNEFELYPQDIEINFTPMKGEFVICSNSKSKKQYIAIIDDVPDRPCCYVLNTSVLNFNAEEYINKCIVQAYQSKNKFYEDCFRVIHGASDGLPGVIVDNYKNCCLVQINLSGFDQYRSLIKSKLEVLTSHAVYIVDDEAKREKSFLPKFEKENLPEVINIVENEIYYQIENTVIQKNGYYYDHRENRLKARRWVENLASERKYNCIDLFSYVGSWGLNILKTGKVENMEYVDQGDFENTININMKLNSFGSNYKFQRADVFKYVDELILRKVKFDVICCDPPAFSKSIKKKANAIEGYKKIINKLLKISENNGFIFFGSCTKYVTLEDLMDIFRMESNKQNLKLKLIDIGTQSFDHTNYGMQDKSNYIKFCAYRLEY